MGFGITALEAADGFEDFVAVFQASLGDAALEFLECLGEGTALAATHGAFLAAAGLAAGQQIVNVVALQELDLDLGVVGQALPAVAALELSLEFSQGLAARGQEVASARFAEKGQRF